MVNIVTVEDPVEANVDGVNQVQVNPKANLTFGNALRSILRQDPDIIMFVRPHTGRELKSKSASSMILRRVVRPHGGVS